MEKKKPVTVKKLKQKQLGPWCSYCSEKTVRAVHQGCGFGKFACEQHLPNLEKNDYAERHIEDFSDAAFSLPRYI